MIKCMFCNKEALDGHLTCGDVGCPESSARAIKQAAWIKQRFAEEFGLPNKKKDDDASTT